jgi:hypothetical protein
VILLACIGKYRHNIASWTYTRIVAQLDAEIKRLTEARDALLGLARPRGRTSRTWSAAARARQSRMMKQRWVKRKNKNA